MEDKKKSFESHLGFMSAFLDVFDSISHRRQHLKNIRGQVLCNKIKNSVHRGGIEK